jgi:hypothetical protein
LPELRFQAAGQAWCANLPRGASRQFVAPTGVSADSLSQRLLEGQVGAGHALRWHPDEGLGAAVISDRLPLISNLQIWENILLPWRYHHPGLPPDAERVLSGALGFFRPGQPAAPWLHRPVTQLTSVDRRIAQLLRALVSPAPLIVVAADWLQAAARADAPRWLDWLTAYVDGERRALLYVDPGSEPGEPLLTPLEWSIVNDPDIARGSHAAAAQ